jgi:hypothetical protein
MRAFYLGWPMPQTKPAKSNAIPVDVGHSRFPLPWSHYARLLAVRNAAARAFYESEVLRGGWTIRQLDCQIQSQFYERTALSRDKAAMLRGGARSLATDTMTPDEEIKNPSTDGFDVSSSLISNSANSRTRMRDRCIYI